MEIPGVNSRTIADLVPDVVDALQGRTDVSAIAPRYIRRALMEICESTPFEELRRTGPQVSLTTNQPIYPASFFLNNNDDYTFFESFVIFIDFPTNSVVQVMRYKTPNAIENMLTSATTGIPGYWTRFGTNIHLGPTPNNTYTMFARYQVRYPFTDATDATSLLGTKLLIPDTWEEIIVYSAALRIAVVKRWNDQCKYLHDLLYGDPEFQMTAGKRGRPGLVAARQLQVERDQMFSTRQLGILIPRYNAR